MVGWLASRDLDACDWKEVSCEWAEEEGACRPCPTPRELIESLDPSPPPAVPALPDVEGKLRPPLVEALLAVRGAGATAGLSEPLPKNFFMVAMFEEESFK